MRITFEILGPLPSPFVRSYNRTFPADPASTVAKLCDSRGTVEGATASQELFVAHAARFDVKDLDLEVEV